MMNNGYMQAGYGMGAYHMDSEPDSDYEIPQCQKCGKADGLWVEEEASLLIWIVSLIMFFTGMWFCSWIPLNYRRTYVATCKFCGEKEATTFKEAQESFFLPCAGEVNGIIDVTYMKKGKLKVYKRPVNGGGTSF